MINGVTMKICVDDYILRTLKEDINDEDVSTNAVMPVNKQGSAQLICKDDGVICGLDVFFRTFRLLDDTARFDCAVQDGDWVNYDIEKRELNIELSDEELQKRMAAAELRLQPKTGWLSIYQRCVGSILKGATLIEDNRE